MDNQIKMPIKLIDYIDEDKSDEEILKEITTRFEYLRQQTNFTAALFRSISGYAVIAANFDGEIIAYNTGAEHILGYPAEKIVTESINVDIFFPKDFIEGGGLQDIINHVMSDGLHIYEGEMVRQNGDRFPAKIILSLVKTNEGKMIGFVEVVEDLTERKRWEEEIKTLNAELEDKVIERTAQLKERLDELERFRKATIQREFRVKELRDRVAELEGKKDIQDSKFKIQD